METTGSKRQEVLIFIIGGDVHFRTMGSDEIELMQAVNPDGQQSMACVYLPPEQFPHEEDE